MIERDGCGHGWGLDEGGGIRDGNGYGYGHGDNCYEGHDGYGNGYGYLEALWGSGIGDGSWTAFNLAVANGDAKCNSEADDVIVAILEEEEKP